MKVGDYVRIHGYIDKIININDFREPSMKYALERPSWNDDIIVVGEEDIDKSSPNIIDLIEVGDYVNGMEVTYIGGTRYDENDLHCYCEHNGNENWKQVMIPAKDIKSIVTREQFSQMQYKVGE